MNNKIKKLITTLLFPVAIAFGLTACGGGGGGSPEDSQEGTDSNAGAQTPEGVCAPESLNAVRLMKSAGGADFVFLFSNGGKNVEWRVGGKSYVGTAGYRRSYGKFAYLDLDNLERNYVVNGIPDYTYVDDEGNRFKIPYHNFRGKLTFKSSSVVLYEGTRVTYDFDWDVGRVVPDVEPFSFELLVE